MKTLPDRVLAENKSSRPPPSFLLASPVRQILAALMVCLLSGCGLLRFPSLSPEDRLTYYSLLYVADESDLREYLSLGPDARQEWLRRFWKMRDPTPTTNRNEFRQEHDRRVDVAREQFGKVPLGRPWDDRGEVYIKYGAPRAREIDVDREEWQYDRLDRHFLFVDQHLTGHFELSAGGGNPQDFAIARARDVGMVRETFQFDYGNPPLPVSMSAARFRGVRGDVRVRVSYTLPLRALGRGPARGTLLERRIAVFDRDWREVVRDTLFVRLHPEAPGSEDGLLAGGIEVELEPGSYQIVLETHEETGRITVCRRNIEAVGYLRGAQQVSDLVLGWTGSGGEQPGFIPNPAGRFGAAETVAFRCGIYDAQREEGPGAPAVLCRVRDRGGRVRRAQEEQALSLENSTWAGLMPLDGIPPGDYVLEVRARRSRGKENTALAPFSVGKGSLRPRPIVLESEVAEDPEVIPAS